VQCFTIKLTINDRNFRNNDDDSEKHVKKPTLLSTIVSVSGPTMTVKEEPIAVRKPEDRKGLARNRRMFGMILGTLQKFQSEETTRKEVVSVSIHFQIGYF
jgi:pinin